MAEGWQSARLDEIEPIPVLKSTLLWRPVRRTLDIGAFGINAYVAHNAGDDVVEEHDESTLGHEEVYLVLSGRATFSLGGETLDAPAGTLVFISEPTIVRHARAEEPGTSVLAIGGPRGAAYEPSPWEDFFAAQRHRNTGDYAAFEAALDEVLLRRPDHPGTLYNVARAKVLVGKHDEAVVHLRRAVELNPDLVAYALSDDDFASLREHRDWPI
ncbi:MAG TPA: hypothetical protein VMN35_03745 [Gaiellaceae bacterium]|nr:hypothetical protein [Gaiellaceae bacterium]